MKKPAKPIRVRTYWRTGSGTKLVEDKVLTPLTAAERKAGVRDEYGEYVARFGNPGSSPKERHRGPEYIREGNPELNLRLKDGDIPSDEDQKAIYRLMKPHLMRLSWDLVQSGLIGKSDMEDMAMRLFCSCCVEFHKWNPEKASLKTYLYQVAASEVCDFARSFSYAKREFPSVHLGIENRLEDDEDMSSATGNQGTVCLETLPMRKALDAMLFQWAYDDLLELLDADELLAFDYLVNDYTQEEIAGMMRCSVASFRRHILRSIQLKADLCGFTPHNGTFVK